MIKKTLVIVPHPDDEINLAGGLFETFKSHGIYTTVAFCTNGDYYPKYTKKRYDEVLKAKRVLGYDEVVFLGYGDGLADTNFYNIGGDQVITTPSGHNETYCVGEMHEFCFQKNNKHHKYTRNNFKNDIKEVILTQYADLIICVDIDCHYDHRCVSLLFDECIGEIVKSGIDYHPIILKGFAYMGTWAGIDDFFSSVVQPVKPSIDRFHIDEECTYPHMWSNRIRIRNSTSAISLKLWRNPIFNAILAHRTQRRFLCPSDNAFVKFPGIANPETCYWIRRIDNLALKATISATSGNVTFLNDFKIFDTNGVIQKEIFSKECGWHPAHSDFTREICIDFGLVQTIRLIKIYQGYKTNLQRIRIIVDDGNYFDHILDSGIGDTISLYVNLSTVKLRLQVLEAGNKNICIHEIECYSDDTYKDWNLHPLIEYKDEVRTNPYALTKIVELLYRMAVWLLLLINKILYKEK